MSECERNLLLYDFFFAKKEEILQYSHCAKVASSNFIFHVSIILGKNVFSKTTQYCYIISGGNNFRALETGSRTSIRFGVFYLFHLFSAATESEIYGPHIFVSDKIYVIVFGFCVSSFVL